MGVLEKVIWGYCGFTYSSKAKESKGENEDSAMDPQEIQALMRAKSYFPTKARKRKNPMEWDYFKRLRDQVTWSIRKAKLQYFEKLCNQSVGKPRKMWSELNRLLGMVAGRRLIF